MENKEVRRNNMANKKVKTVHNKVSVEAMFHRLSKDLRDAHRVSYGSNGINIISPDGEITWEFKAKRLYRYQPVFGDINGFTVSEEPVFSFKYQGLFGGYMAFEITSGEGPMYAMIQVR